MKPGYLLPYVLSRLHVRCLTGFSSQAFLACAMLCGCAPTRSPEASGRLIARLSEAATADRANALDTEVGPITQGDYMLLADKADQVADDLTNGRYVPDSRIAEALFVPPKIMPLKTSAELIAKLEAARELDQRGWCDYTWRQPAAGLDFLVQERKATRAIHKLRTQPVVSWIEIADALVVPPYP